jgi:hypothetical protein
MTPLGERSRSRRQFENDRWSIEVIVRHLDELAHPDETPQQLPHLIVTRPQRPSEVPYSVQLKTSAFQERLNVRP